MIIDEVEINIYLYRNFVIVIKLSCWFFGFFDN